MDTKWEKMLAGELYDPVDAQLVRARNRARDLCKDLNATREEQAEERDRVGRVGGRWSHHLPGRAHRLALRDWSRERGDARHS